MASIWKHPQSKYWVACYTDLMGKQRKASTKIEATEKNRLKALKVASELETAHKQRMTTTQIVRLCGELAQEVTGEKLASVTVREFLDGYMKRREGEIAPKTQQAYQQAATRFLEWLGDAAEGEMFRIERKHILDFRDHLRASLSAVSVNKYVKYLGLMFRDAKRDRVIFDNPCADVASLKKEKNEGARRGFTLEELKTVLREVAGTEWVSLIRFGLYTGQRLGDLAGLQWGQVDLEGDEVRFTTQKTGRVVNVPLCEPLRDHILSLEVADKHEAPVHPRAAELGVSHLSREFGEILGRCGFRPVTAANHSKAKNGRAGARRDSNALTFHSLRHSAVSMMKNAGISPAVVQDLVGHDSEAVSRAYTHIESAAKLKALETLPVI